jgi:hypothetical protein
MIVYGAFAGPGLKFIENKNQWPKQVLFSSDVNGGQIFLLKDRFRINFSKAPRLGRGHHNFGEGAELNDDGSQTDSETIFSHAFDVTFLNANSTVALTGTKQLKTTFNYLIGSDRTKWTQNAKSFSEIIYTDVYNGVNLSVYSQGTSMKYEWILKPQADPQQIQLRYDGASELNLDNGNLHIKTSINEIWEYKPYAYQIKSGKKIQVPCEFNLNNKVLTYFFPEEYDECYELVIDPILIFSAYSGSTLDNWGNSATYDSHGNTYSGGIVQNPNHTVGYPTTVGAYQTNSKGGDWDIGILKYDSSGTNVLYATYLGGTGVETPQSLVVNNQGELLVMGATSSHDFPVTNGSTFKGGETIDPIWGITYGGGTDIYVAKLSESGDALLAGTYLGGSKNDGVNFISGKINEDVKTESPLARNYGDQLRGDIITDSNDTVYVAASTMSEDFTGKINSYSGGSHDAVIIKLPPDLSSPKWVRLLGGSKTDAAYSIKLKSGQVYLAGGTNSTNFPGVNGIHTTLQGDVDGWLASLSQKSGQIINATYLGTSEYDQAYFIDLNTDGEVYTYGQTKGKYPVTANVFSNEFAGQFIHKLSTDFKNTIFSTTIGSKGTATSINPNISPTAFSVNDCNTLYISGWGGRDNIPTFKYKDEHGNIKTFSSTYIGGDTKSMPLTTDAHQKTTQGSDFYLAVLTSDASKFLYGTYLGGSQSATHVDGGTSRFDKKGIVYHAVCAGCGGHSDFPAVNVPVAHQTNRSDNCNNAVFKFDLSTLKAKLQTNSVDLDMPGITNVCWPDPIVFQNKSIGGQTFEWQMGDGTTFSLSDTIFAYKYDSAGTYEVKLKATDNRTCVGTDETSVTVHVFKRTTSIDPGGDICPSSSFVLKSEGNGNFNWTLKDGTVISNDNLNEHIVTPEDTTEYYVTITEPSGCITKDSVRVNVIPKADVDFKIDKIFTCFSRPRVELINTSPKLKDTDTQMFSFGDTETSDLDHVTHDYKTDGEYNIKLTISREFCIFEKTIPVKIYTVKSPNVITPGDLGDLNSKNDVFSVQYSDTPGKTPNDFGYQVSIIIYNRWGKQVYQSNDYKNDWSGDGLAPGVYYYELKISGETVCKDWVHVIK